VRLTRVLAVAGAAVALVSGCSASAVDSSCDVAGISQEVEHMVGESHLEMAALDTLQCSGAWALAKATVAGTGQSPQTLTFVFKRSDSGWFLKAPEIVCGRDPGMETVAEELKADACAAT
jgi:hypothetical protein